MPDLDALRDRYLDLTREALPARAAAEGWPLRFDHCFMRVVLDDVFGGVWYDHVEGRPAYRHLDADALRAAIAVAESILDEGEPRLRALDAQSLRFRGKRPKPAPRRA
ncbi:MAG: hypothetical protein AAF845_01465 [Bacteroidota bacterium]